MKIRPGLRFTALLALFLHMFGGSVLPLMHAAAEGQAAIPHNEHIESQSTNACVPHTDEFCQVCRAGSVHYRGTVVVALPAHSALVHSIRQPGQSKWVVQTPVWSALGPRAPPSA